MEGPRQVLLVAGLKLRMAGVDSILFERGNAVSLANVIQCLVEKPEVLQSIGCEAIKAVRNKTHFQMHQQRAEHLKSVLCDQGV